MRLSSVPAHVLSEKIVAPKYAVIGEYSRWDGGKIVWHVALLREQGAVEFGQQVEVWHTFPPLVAGPQTSERSGHEYDRCKAHCLSYIEDLTQSEIDGITTKLEELDKQIAPASKLEQYSIEPPVDSFRDEETGTKRYLRFSCVGFVVECYKDAVVLLSDDRSGFPGIDREILLKAYRANDKVLRRFGVKGDPPWRLAMPGYVLHSMNRPAEEVRRDAYVPAAASEASFP
jgi:hypothetical protein